MTLSSFLDINSRAVNVATVVLTSVVGVISSILVLLLFLSPQSLRLQSLITPDAIGIKPTTAVTLLAAVLIGVTASLINRAVEQSLWLKLAPRDVGNKVTIGESRRLAQWSVSPLAKLLYLFSGDRWLLKPVGILVVALAVVGPVLVSGISQASSARRMLIDSLAHSSDMWTGWLDLANEAFNGGEFRDIPGITAGFVYLNNLSAPASSICSDLNCTVTAVTASIRADCKTTSSPHAQLYQLNLPQWTNETYYSTLDPNVNVILSEGSPYTYANFTSSYPPDCAESCAEGEFAIIFGAFVNNTDNPDGPYYLNTVDCLLTYGTVSITQRGGTTPTLDENSFQMNTTGGYLPSIIAPLRRIYCEEPYYSSQYAFAGSSGTGDGTDSLFGNPFGMLLLSAKADSSGDEVASRIENIFQMATLMAFSRSPYSSDLTITTVATTPVYDYDKRVLAVLIMPFLATLFGLYGRCRVTGKDIFVGYDPVEIARRGPVDGLPETSSADGVEKKHVWCATIENETDANGNQVPRNGFVVD